MSVIVLKQPKDKTAILQWVEDNKQHITFQYLDRKQQKSPTFTVGPFVERCDRVQG